MNNAHQILARCDNCEWVGPEDKTKPWFESDRYVERLDVGGEVPAGECPECGAWAYRVNVSCIPDIMSGAPCVTGTRIRVMDVVPLVRIAGLTKWGTLESYPHLTSRQIEDAMRYHSYYHLTVSENAITAPVCPRCGGGHEDLEVTMRTTEHSRISQVFKTCLFPMDAHEREGSDVKEIHCHSCDARWEDEAVFVKEVWEWYKAWKPDEIKQPPQAELSPSGADMDLDYIPYLLIVLFDVGSDDHEPYAYVTTVGKSFIDTIYKDTYSQEERNATFERIRAVMMVEDDAAIVETAAGLEPESMITVRYLSENQLVELFADKVVSNAMYLGDITGTGLSLSSDALAAKGMIPSVELLLGECECGYHFTVDHTFIDQIGDFEFNCVACHKVIKTPNVFPER